MAGVLSVKSTLCLIQQPNPSVLDTASVGGGGEKRRRGRLQRRRERMKLRNRRRRRW